VSCWKIIKIWLFDSIFDSSRERESRERWILWKQSFFFSNGRWTDETVRPERRKIFQTKHTKSHVTNEWMWSKFSIFHFSALRTPHARKKENYKYKYILLDFSIHNAEWSHFLSYLDLSVKMLINLDRIRSRIIIADFFWIFSLLSHEMNVSPKSLTTGNWLIQFNHGQWSLCIYTSVESNT